MILPSDRNMCEYSKGTSTRIARVGHQTNSFSWTKTYHSWTKRYRVIFCTILLPIAGTCIPNLNGGYLMRHFYFRLIFGIVWLAAAIVSAAGAIIPFAVLDAVLGILFLRSAYSIRKKEKGERSDGESGR